MVALEQCSGCYIGRVAASIPMHRDLAALAEPDLESYTIRLPA